MSPGMTRALEILERFPRVSGDEPLMVPIQYGSTRFSPRERG